LYAIVLPVYHAHLFAFWGHYTLMKLTLLILVMEMVEW